MTSPTGSLVRGLGRWDLTAFAINRVIGAGIFGIPAVLYAGVGNWSIVAMVSAALAITLITLCFAEVGSAFRDTGGPYLYALRTFGPGVGFEVGWLLWVTQLGGFAAVINLFVNYLGWFIPEATTGAPRVAIIAAVTGVLATINILGIQRAALINNILTLAKLVPLAVFVLVGAFFIDQPLLPGTAPSTLAFSAAVLVAVYAFSGFEVLGVPSGEVEDPGRTIPFALLGGLAVVTVVYLSVMTVAIGTLPGLGESSRPLADAAGRILGPAGAGFLVLGAIVSTLGVSHAMMLAAGRMPFAMAERGQLPAGLARVHSRWHTPARAVLACAAGMLGFTILTTFTSALTITVGLRVIIYIVTCAALPVLRRRADYHPAFRVPLGGLVALLAVGIAVFLLAMRPWRETRQLLFVLLIGLLVWLACGVAVRRGQAGDQQGRTA